MHEFSEFLKEEIYEKIQYNYDEIMAYKHFVDNMTTATSQAIIIMNQDTILSSIRHRDYIGLSILGRKGKADFESKAFFQLNTIINDYLIGNVDEMRHLFDDVKIPESFTEADVQFLHYKQGTIHAITAVDPKRSDYNSFINVDLSIHLKEFMTLNAYRKYIKYIFKLYQVIVKDGDTIRTLKYFDYNPKHDI